MVCRDRERDGHSAPLWSVSAETTKQAASSLLLKVLRGTRSIIWQLVAPEGDP